MNAGLPIPDNTLIQKAKHLAQILAVVWPTFAGASTAWTHFGVRPLAMGNAYVALADDFNMLFYNPAGLGFVKEWDGEFLNPAFAFSSNSLAVTTTIMTAMTEGTLGDNDLAPFILDVLAENFGRNLYAGFQLTPHIYFPNWGMGAGIDFSLNTTMHRSISTKFDFRTPMVVMPISGALTFLEDRLSVGASIKGLFLAGIQKTLNATAIASFTDLESAQKFVEVGYGFGFDVGILFKPFPEYQPSLGVSFTDIASSVLFAMDGFSQPKTRQMSVNIGTSFVPLEWDRSSIRLLFDIHQSNLPIHYSHKLKFGAEWQFSRILKVQLGLGDGLLSAGMALDVGLINMRFATYGVDGGTVVGQSETLSERRFVAQLRLLI